MSLNPETAIASSRPPYYGKAPLGQCFATSLDFPQVLERDFFFDKKVLCENMCKGSLSVVRQLLWSLNV